MEPLFLPPSGLPPPNPPGAAPVKYRRFLMQARMHGEEHFCSYVKLHTSGAKILGKGESLRAKKILKEFEKGAVALIYAVAAAVVLRLANITQPISKNEE